jgi:hypothetical protein
MATVPYGCITEPLVTLATMLSYCPAFQLWVEEADDDIPASGDARALFCLDFIHYPIYDKPDGDWVFPAAEISVPQNVDYSVVAQTVSGGLFDTGSGTLELNLYRKAPDALRNNVAAAWLDFAGVAVDGVKQGVGKIIEDLRDLPDSVTKFEEYDLDVSGPAFFTESKRPAMGLVVMCTIKINWGVG